MFFSNLRTRCGTFLVMLLAMTFPLRAGYTIYFEPYDNWDTVWTWVWDSNNGNQNYSGGNWPGIQIYQSTDHPGLYVYTFECTASNPALKCIFNDGSTNVQESEKPQHQTSDFQLKDNWVYTYSGALCDIADYETPDPGELTDYTISFHNNVGWDNIYVRISGTNPPITGLMSSFLNSSVFDYAFQAPENTTLYCQFYTLVNSQEQNLTSKFKVIDKHVYTISGDKGLKENYDPINALPEAEYWIEPATPAVTQSATLYYNRAYNPDGNLRNSDNIYAHIGLLTSSDPNQLWPAASDWNNPDSKFKMTPVSEGSDVYKISFNPTIADWFGKDSEGNYNRIGVVFRDPKAGLQSPDYFIPLRVLPPVGEGLGAAQNCEADANGNIVITSERGKIYLTPWSDDIVKVFTLRNSATNRTERPSISVIDDQTKLAYGIGNPSFEIKDTDDRYVIAISGGVTVEVDKATSLLSFFNSKDSSEPTLSELGGLVNKTGSVSASFNGMGDTGFYGGGYNGNLVNWNGYTMTMNNNQDGNWGQGSSLSRNICIPFYVSTSGYGLYFDDHYRNATIYTSSSGSVYSSKSQDPIAYYYIGGGSMENVLQNYTRLTGLQELPPYWALGYLTSKFSFATRQEAEDAVKNTKDINIPIDGIVFDIHWQTDNHLRGAGTSGMGRIDWSDAYPNPVEMMKNFRDQNVHTIAITEPYFTSKSGNYDYLKNAGYLADEHVNGMGWLESDHVGLLDITNKDATDWFKDLYKKRTAEGIESWWLDLGEPEKHDSDSHYSDGSSVDQMNNEYGNRWTAIAFQAMKEQTPDTRFITMPRAGTSGMQRYNAFPWTGDIARSWSGLKAQVPALVSASMSGVSYLGSDIGGFIATGTDANLYRRWVQLGVFYPSMRTHSAKEPEVWRGSYASVRDDVRDAINLRYAYLPYTYSQSYAYTRFGTPIARPANFNDRDYPEKLANCIDAYLWGPDVYVAPVLDNGTSKSITFPEGEWLDMNDFKTVYTSHQSVNYSAPTNVLPHFMRRGSFVTRYRQDKFTNTAEIETDKLTVDYFPTKSSTPDGSIFFDDDHKSVNTIEEGKYVVTRFSGKGADNSLLLYIDREGNGWEGMYETQDVLLRIHAVDMTGVNLDNIGFYDQQTQKRNAPMREASETPWSYSKIEKATSLDDVQNATRTTNAYYVDPASRTAYVRLPRLNPLETYNVELGEPGILTGIETPAALEAMTLAYGNGYFTYSAPQGTEDLTIGVFSVTGTQVALFSGLNADGYAGQIETDLPSGIYIARLTGRNSAGETRDKTIKMIVK